MQIIQAQAMDGVLAMDAVVVVGRRSNQSERLLEKCRARGVRAFQVESAEELLPLWFAGCRCVGLTAGTSTPRETVAQVEARLAGIAEVGARRVG